MSRRTIRNNVGPSLHNDRNRADLKERGKDAYSLATMPFISVITICRNASTTIEKTLKSVAALNYPNFEYIVVDGASTDDTMDIVKRYASHIRHWISEPDNGIADALNKAIALSSGEYHILVHADDTIDADGLYLLAKTAIRDRAPVVCGSVAVTKNNVVVRMYRPVPHLLLEKMSIPHMGCLLAKQTWSEFGGYDVRRRIAMDHKLMLQIWRRYGPAGFTVADCTVARYSLGGISDRQVLKGFHEVRENLLEEGIPRAAALIAYWKLRLKYFITNLGFLRTIRSG